MRNKFIDVKLYTQDLCFHKLLNNSLRSLEEPTDLAYIRFPFLRLFMTVIELFLEQ